ncbi:MAG: outer membrane protein TolC [Crocinitomicaceae bacterium]|jgi:outer membrane protein TolC
MKLEKIVIFSLWFVLSVGHINAQSLESILQLAVENNRELKALQLEYEAELLKVDQVSQLPNPLFGAGVPVLRPETRLGPQVMMVSASQMFPWFGTLKAKEDAVITMSKAKFERIAAIRLDLFNQIKNSYYTLQFLHEKDTIIKEIIGQFEMLKSVSLSKVEGGSNSMANVLRVQLKIDELHQKVQKLTLFKKKVHVGMNTITYQPLETKIEPILNEQYPFVSFDLEKIRIKVTENYPLLVKLDQEIEASINRQLVNQKMGNPQIGIGIDYALVSERTDMDPQYNGRDVFVPKVMISVPLYRKKYKAKDKEELLTQNSLQLRREDLAHRILGQLVKFKADYDNAILDIELYEKQIVTTQSAYNILLTEYSSSGKGFDDLLQLQNQLLGYSLDLKEAKMMAWIASSNIERYTDY